MTESLDLSPGQMAALRALVDHGGVKQAVHALGISDRALARRNRRARDRNGGVTTHRLAYLLGVQEPAR